MSYEVSIVRILEKIDSGIRAPHYIYHIFTGLLFTGLRHQRIYQQECLLMYVIARRVSFGFRCPNCDSYSVSVAAVKLTISCYIGLCYNGTQLYSEQKMKRALFNDLTLWIVQSFGAGKSTLHGRHCACPYSHCLRCWICRDCQTWVKWPSLNWLRMGRLHIGGLNKPCIGMFVITCNRNTTFTQIITCLSHASSHHRQKRRDILTVFE